MDEAMTNGAGGALQGAAMAALRAISGIGVHEGAPVQAAFPYAIVEVGAERDWSHKSGIGRELRLALVLRDGGERPVRLRQLLEAAETAMESLSIEAGSWQLVTFQLTQSRLAREPGRSGGSAGWIGAIEYRARMLRP